MGVSNWLIYRDAPPVEWSPGFDPVPDWLKHPGKNAESAFQEMKCKVDFKMDEDLGLVIDSIFPSTGWTDRIVFGKDSFVQESLYSIFKSQEALAQRKIAEVTQHELRLSAAQQEIQTLQETNRLLAEQLARARQEQFGTSSEQSEPLSPEIVCPSETDEPPDPVTKPPRLVSKAGRKPLPAHLPREDVVCDLPPDQKKCERCNQDMQFIGEEETQRLEHIPARFVVKRFLARKYVCRCCTRFAVAPVPKSVISGSSFGSPSILADMAVNKYQFAIPLYRLTQIYERAGMRINRTTMADLMSSMADRLTPLYVRMHEILLDQDVIHADETVIQVLREPGRPPQSQSYMWQYCSGTHAAQQIAMFEYQPTRAGAHALKFLTKPDGEVFSGYLQVDGYAGYNAIDAAARVGCMAHVRRKFVEALQAVPAENAKDSIALHPIGLIQQLYVIEAQLKTASVAERARMRQAKSVPILNQLKDWLDEQVKVVLPKALMGKAIHYALAQWPYVIRFVENGLLSIDNNIAERSIKNLVIGRKNWLFSTSMDGAYATAVLTSMVRTALANKLDPYQYLVQVLQKLPYAKSDGDFQELMPWFVKNQLDEAAANLRQVA